MGYEGREATIRVSLELTRLCLLPNLYNSINIIYSHLIIFNFVYRVLSVNRLLCKQYYVISNIIYIFISFLLAQ